MLRNSPQFTTIIQYTEHHGVLDISLDIGPAAYSITAADLKTIHSGNSLIKFADDTYLVIPSANASTRQQEIGHIATWAATNNLKLNV